MKFNFSLIFLLALMVSGLSAQVKGISYTIAPGANYTLFDNRAGLNDAFMIGGRLGMGFGEYVELRGQYYQTVDGKIDFGAFDLDETDFDNTSVDLARYGAQLKLNLGRGRLLPYLLIGAGVQDIERQGLEVAQNIYGSGGLGLTLSASDRFTFSVEGQYLGYRFNALRNLLDPAERDLNNVDLNDTEAERLGNFTIGANLAIYLGGRRPGKLSEIDEAYLNAFGNGISGIRIPVEVEFAHVNFDNSLAFRDAWFAGLRAGLDFGPYVGLRAFYLQGMDENSLNFNFDDLAMYGLDLRLNLGRVDRGFTPFIILGGGRLNAQDGYVGRVDRKVNSQAFATGGLGTSIRLGKSFRLNGAYRVLLTSQEEFGDIDNTDQLTSSNMFSLGLNLAFGKKPRPNQLVETKVQVNVYEQAQEYDNRIAQLRAENKAKTKEMRKKYEARIAELENQMNAALEADNYILVDRLRGERDEARMIVQELEEQEAWAKRVENNYLEEYAGDPDSARGFQGPISRLSGSSPVDTYGSVQDPDRANQEQESDNSAPNITLSFDQLLELVRAATPQPTSYVYPGVAGHNNRLPARREAVDQATQNNRSRARQPLSSSNSDPYLQDIRQELLLLQQEQAQAGNQEEVDRYQRMINETYRIQPPRNANPNEANYNDPDDTDSEWDGVGTPPSDDYQGGIYLGTDGKGRQARDLPDYSAPQPEKEIDEDEIDGKIKTDPATLKKIRGFDPDAEQPDVMVIPEEKDQERNATKPSGKKKPKKKAPKKPKVPYEKDGSGG